MMALVPVRTAAPTPPETGRRCRPMGTVGRGIDVFPGQERRQAHLDGPIAAALMSKADELLSSPPEVKAMDVLADKLPG